MLDLWICLGSVAALVVVMAFILLMRFISYRENLALAEKGMVRPAANQNGKSTLHWGIIIAAVGLALCLGLAPIGSLIVGGSFVSMGWGPWMLLGLIPLFFGLALILIYVLTYSEKKPEPPALVEKSPEEPPSQPPLE